MFLISLSLCTGLAPGLIAHRPDRPFWRPGPSPAGEGRPAKHFIALPRPETFFTNPVPAAASGVRPKPAGPRILAPALAPPQIFISE